MDGVKLMANGIRLEKEIIKKENPTGKSTKKRSVSHSHDVTSITKDPDANVIIDATSKSKGKKKKADNDESSVDRTEENDSTTEESKDKKEEN